MKTTLRVFAALAALAIAAPAQAQGGGGGGMQQMSPEQRLTRTKEQLFKDITLSADQSAKADTILMKAMRTQMESMQAARSGGGDMSSMREAMEKLNAERNTALKALLTSDEHKKKFDENVANMPAMGRRGAF